MIWFGDRRFVVASWLRDASVLRREGDVVVDVVDLLWGTNIVFYADITLSQPTFWI